MTNDNFIMHIESTFDLGACLYPLVGNFLGPIYFKRVTISPLPGETLICGQDFIVHHRHEKTNTSNYVLFKPVGEESIVGDLFGFEITPLESKPDSSVYPSYCLLSSTYHKVKKISIYGEKIREGIWDKHALEALEQSFYDGWPDQITYHKQTAILIAIQFITDEWIYVQSGGDADFRMMFPNNITDPEQFIHLRNFKEVYEHFDLIETIGT